MRGKQQRRQSGGGGLMDQMQSRATRLLMQYRSQQPQTQFWRQEDWSVDYLRDTDPIFRRMKAGQLHLIAQQAIAGIEIESPPPSEIDDLSTDNDEGMANITLVEVQVHNFQLSNLGSMLNFHSKGFEFHEPLIATVIFEI